MAIASRSAACSDATLGRTSTLWSWTHHEECADRYAAASRHDDNAHLNFVRLTSDAEIDNLVTTACRQVAT